MCVCGSCGSFVCVDVWFVSVVRVGRSCVARVTLVCVCVVGGVWGE